MEVEGSAPIGAHRSDTAVDIEVGDGPPDSIDGVGTVGHGANRTVHQGLRLCAVILHELEQVIVDRRTAAPESSYTATLLADPVLAQRKIMEEAFEVCLELGADRPDRTTTAAEAADLVYHPAGRPRRRRCRRRRRAGRARAEALVSTSDTVRVAVPSKGRLRESCLDLLSHAGYRVGGFKGMASANTAGIEFLEMRPRDAAAWLHAGQLDGAFISTDTALEHEVDGWPSTALGFARSDLVVACREDAAFATVSDLAGATVATHLPGWTARWFDAAGIDVTVVTMGGSLEGVCAVGMADAIVDLRETGGSLARNRLRVLETVEACQALFTTAPDAPPAVADLVLRLGAALAARRTQYVMLHLPSERLDALGELFPGLAAPTVLPLAGRDDLVAAHIVVNRQELWARLADLRALGATGIVALPTDAILE